MKSNVKSNADRLYPHQVAGAVFLAANGRAGLFDEQGLGKTITAIEAANQLREFSLIPGGWRVLVVCPTVVLWNWAREWERWSTEPDQVQVVESLSDKINLSANVVILTHRAVIEPRVHEQLVARTWNLAVLDEAHFFRNRKAARTRAFYGDYRFDHPSVVGRAQRVWLLTGTPMPNDVRNLWTMCWGLWPERFPSASNPSRPMSFGEFEDRYCVTEWTQWGGKRALSNRNTDELRSRIKDVTLRRLKKDVLDLPPVRHESITLRPEKMPHQLPVLEGKLGPALQAALQDEVDPEEAFRLMGRHAEFSTWRRLCALAKVDPVVDLLSMELEDTDERVVVFAHHKQVVDELERGFDKILGPGKCVRITGETTPAQRQRAVTRFQLDPMIRVALCQIVAGGTGVTLTESTEVVFVELSWVPAENAQAADRVHRIGQDRPCRVRYVSLAGTVDEPLVEVLRRKVRMIREVVK